MKRLFLCSFLLLAGCELEDLDGTLCNSDQSCGEGYFCDRSDNRCRTGAAPIPDVVRFTPSTPASPARETSVTLRGVAPGGTTVRVFTNATCSGQPALETSAEQFNASGFSTSVPANSSSSFTATATNPQGYSSACSDPFVYVSDSLPPARPTITGPVSPGNDLQPGLTGTAEPLAAVQIFRGNSCGSTPIAAGTAELFAGAGIEADADANATTTYTALAVDGAGNASVCSSPFNYTSDTVPPTAPSVSAVLPDEQANTVNPRVVGSGAEGGSTVQIFSGPCTGTAVGTGSADVFHAEGVQVTVAQNTTHDFFARVRDAAGNFSPCSGTSLPFYADFEIAAPSGLAIVGGSVNNSTPSVSGVVSEPGTVEILLGDCNGAVVGTGTEVNFAGAGVAVAFTPPNSTQTYVARLVDRGGNVSGCSEPLVHFADFPPTLTSTPVSPNASRRPRLRGSIAAGVQVEVFRSPDCSAQSLGVHSSAAFAAGLPHHSIPAESSTVFSAQSIGDGTDRSTCVSYTYQASCNASGFPTSVCTSGCTSYPISPLQGVRTPPDDVFANGMVACGGVRSFANKLELCRPGAVATGAAAWASGRGSVIPYQHYWTAEDLDWAGSDSGSCAAVSDGTGNPCTAGAPMHVNAPTSLDPVGNQSNWLNCGYGSNTPNAYFGGCSLSATAGTLCSPRPSGCADGTTEQRFGQFMFGCGGAVTYPSRASLCAPGCSVCSEKDWVAARQAIAPNRHYWTSYAGGYAGSGSGSCSLGPNDCGPDTPMRVCATGLTFGDAHGNQCNWTGCGFESTTQNDFFGGCSGNTTAGTLCCCPG